MGGPSGPMLFGRIAES
ncbi:DUF6053 domain-containing protein [Lysobacter enzymogenes]